MTASLPSPQIEIGHEKGKKLLFLHPSYVSVAASLALLAELPCVVTGGSEIPKSW
jgi:hypothetical protein